WPGESRVTKASANRLRVALCGLRHTGLENTLVTTPSGWMLNPNVRVERDFGDVAALDEPAESQVLATQDATACDRVTRDSGVSTTETALRPEDAAVEESAA